MKVMISQPMKGLTNQEIINTRNKAVMYLESRGYTVVNTLFTDEWYDKEYTSLSCEVFYPSIYFLSKAIKNMSLCTSIYFCKGWENANGCKIEHEVAKLYRLNIMYE